MSLLDSVFSRVAPTPIESEQLYECPCGEPMECTTAHSTDDCVIQTWECTDPDCLRGGQAYLFDDETDSYGKHALAGQVKGKSR